MGLSFITFLNTGRGLYRTIWQSVVKINVNETKAPFLVKKIPFLVNALLSFALNSSVFLLFTKANIRLNH
jgi:hypothetical protein